MQDTHLLLEDLNIEAWRAYLAICDSPDTTAVFKDLFGLRGLDWVLEQPYYGYEGWGEPGLFNSKVVFTDTDGLLNADDLKRMDYHSTLLPDGSFGSIRIDNRRGRVPEASLTLSTIPVAEGFNRGVSPTLQGLIAPYHPAVELFYRTLHLYSR